MRNMVQVRAHQDPDYLVQNMIIFITTNLLSLF